MNRFCLVAAILVCSVVSGTTFSVVDVQGVQSSRDVKFFAESSLIDQGFSVVDRSSIVQLVREWQYRSYGLDNNEWYKQEVQGVDYIIVLERVEGSSGSFSDRIKLDLSDNITVYLYTYTYSSSARVRIMDMRNRVVSQQIVRGVGVSAYIDQVKSTSSVDSGTLNALVRMGLLATGIGAVIADRNAATTAAQDASFASLGRQVAAICTGSQESSSSRSSSSSSNSSSSSSSSPGSTTYDSAETFSSLLLIIGGGLLLLIVTATLVNMTL